MAREARACRGRIGAALAALLISCAVWFSAWALDPAAQKDGAAKKADKIAPARPQPAAGAAAHGVARPGPELIVVLVRTTLLTLNDALRSDNFTVLRDLASAQFRAENTPGRLSQAFSDLARRGIDLSAVAILTPELSELPSLDTDTNVLRLKGFFEGKPIRIAFELVYLSDGGRWKLLGLSVQPVMAQATKSQPAEAGAQKPAHKAAKP